MYFSQLPQGFPGAESDVTVALAGCDPALITEVRIVTGSGVAGVKRFRGESSYKVDISCYLKGTIGVEPVTPSRYGFFDHSRRVASFSVRATEYTPEEDGPAEDAVWIDSGPLRYTAARVQTPTGIALTEIGGDYEISSGEYFEISVIPGAGRLSAKLGIKTLLFDHQIFHHIDVDEEGSMCTFLVDPSEMELQIEQEIDPGMDLDVEITATGSGPEAFTVSRNVRIRDKTPGGVRLCWLNRFGALDYFTFPSVSRQTFGAQKNRVTTGQGTEVAHIDPYRNLTVQTHYSTPERIAEITGILTSLKVWRISAGEARRVDILSERVDIGQDGLQKMVLEIRDGNGS